jgi:hypothetical protein
MMSQFIDRSHAVPLRNLSAGEAAADASFFDLTSVPECHALCGSAKVRVQLVFP